jgi:hypothetical protein
MKRMLVSLGALAITIGLSGCGSDPREGFVAAAVEQLDNAAGKITNIRKKIEEADNKTDPGKTPDFKDAEKEVEALKKIAKEMQNLKIQTDAVKDKGTEEERKELTDKYKSKLKLAVDRLAKERTSLQETMNATDAKHKDSLKKLREKLQETDGEFESIARAAH